MQWDPEMDVSPSQVGHGPTPPTRGAQQITHILTWAWSGGDPPPSQRAPDSPHHYWKHPLIDWVTGRLHTFLAWRQKGAIEAWEKVDFLDCCQVTLNLSLGHWELDWLDSEWKWALIVRSQAINFTKAVPPHWCGFTLIKTYWELAFFIVRKDGISGCWICCKWWALLFVHSAYL